MLPESAARGFARHQYGRLGITPSSLSLAVAVFRRHWERRQPENLGAPRGSSSGGLGSARREGMETPRRSRRLGKQEAESPAVPASPATPSRRPRKARRGLLGPKAEAALEPVPEAAAGAGEAGPGSPRNHPEPGLGSPKNRGKDLGSAQKQDLGPKSPQNLGPSLGSLKNFKGQDLGSPQRKDQGPQNHPEPSLGSPKSQQNQQAKGAGGKREPGLRPSQSPKKPCVGSPKNHVEPSPKATPLEDSKSAPEASSVSPQSLRDKESVSHRGQPRECPLGQPEPVTPKSGVLPQDGAAETLPRSQAPQTKKRDGSPAPTPAPKKSKQEALVIPKGKPKSGRVWKDRNKKRFSQMVQDKPLRTSWERKMKERQERKLAKDFARHLEEEKQRCKEEKKKRRAENIKRRLENERKAEIVQVIRNPTKLKRAKKKQLRRIEKRDTLALLQKQPPQRLVAKD
ncbi:coiled-coil domain-containing protein 86 [Antechinus flavipes]|uniref:coiled-coil domain-containing protein 86 n=1 Tax=Antechinus flavipes TaxID=38775 RepID=UPI002236216D|nr:coiled-coil domain-containing protein 86 [Antechinus flavipes]